MSSGKRLYKLGVRKVLVTGSGPLGCIPSVLATRSRNSGKCVPELVQATMLYNKQLEQMIKALNKEVKSNVFVASNTQLMQRDFITDPGAFGFQTSKVACCGQGPFNGIGLCTRMSRLCPDRNSYVFWDPFHPTEKACRIIVRMMMTGSERYMNPMNLSSILAMDSRT